MRHNLSRYLLYFLVVVYISGAIGILVNPGFFLRFTPFTLLLTTLVFLLFQPVHKTSYLLSFTAILLIGFLLEIIGVATGLIFGNYSYGDTLGMKILEVPLIISLNWAILLSSGILTGCHLFQNRFHSALISAVIITALDFLIEQVAPSLNFWRFKEGMAGFQNYAAWFMISFSISLVLQSYLGNGNRRIAYILLGLQVLFFGTLNLYKFISF